MITRRSVEVPDPASIHCTSLLLASEGRDFPPAAIDEAARLAKLWGASVHVFSIARIWGTGMGLPMPGLLPSKREWDAQREIVTKAVKELQRRGIKAQGQVLATRRGAKRIIDQARRRYCGAIVMAADPPRNAFVADWMWSQEAYRVRRRSHVPVYLVRTDTPPA